MGKNLYKKLRLILNKKKDENSELKLISKKKKAGTHKNN